MSIEPAERNGTKWTTIGKRCSRSRENESRGAKNSHAFLAPQTAVSDRLDVAVLAIGPMVGDICHVNLHPDTHTHTQRV